MFVCKMGAGPSVNLYSIGGDPLTQYILCKVLKQVDQLTSKTLNLYHTL